MWGFVYQTEPDSLMRFAGRGPSHTLKHGGSHHDYSCDQVFNGIRSVYDVARQENDKARRLFQNMDQRVDELLNFFAVGAARLVELLPHLENNKVLHLGSPTLALAKVSPTFVAFHDPTSHEDCEKAFNKQRERLDSAKGVVRVIVKNLHVLRCVKSQLVPQRMGGRRACVDKVMAFLGRHHFLQISSSFHSFTWEELPPHPVVQDVVHEEAAASIDEHMAAMNLEHKLADAVTWLNEPVSIRVASSGNPQQTEKIFLLEYSRHPESFRKALCEGAPLQACRLALEEANHKYILGSGAKVFVHPHQYACALVAVTELGMDLRPFHVIVSESFQYHVEACLNDLSYRQGARIKRRSTILDRTSPCDEAAEADLAAVAGDGVNDAADADRQEAPQHLNLCDLDMPLIEKQTFICEAPRRRNPESVTQSTTEAHLGGLNPRRVLPASLSD